ncbi:MAG TPA: hypothetical protein PLV93_10015 [Microthrixaceae bacterium]|nr:hypothetical protein [Microthrixaceae bacterium]
MLPERGPARLALWGVGALAVALVRNRLWASPNLAFFTTISDSLGRNPFEGSPLDGSYLLTNLLPVSIARALGQTAAHEYARLHLVVLLMGLGLVVAATHRRFGYEAARALCVLLAAAPVVTIGFEWLGQPDAFTVPLAFGVVIAQRRWTVATLAVLLGLTHAEQGLVIAAVAALVTVALDPNSRGGSAQDIARAGAVAAAPLAAGVLGGRLLVELYLRLNDIVVTTPRTSFFDRGAAEFARLHGEAGGWLAYAMWGPLWMVAIVVVLRRRRLGVDLGRAWALIALANAAPLVAMLATFDETRVFSITAAPVLVGAAVLATATWEQVEFSFPVQRRTLAVSAAGLALAAVPGVFTVDGTHVATDFPATEMGRFLVDGHHPGPDLVTWLIEPLDYDIPSN